MTPEERARQVVVINSVVLVPCGVVTLDERLTHNIAVQIGLAIIEEREACAQLVTAHGCTKVACNEREGVHNYPACPQALAAAIRARGV